MSKTLSAPDRRPRVIAPTTTTKIAARMLAASAVVAEKLPAGFYHSAPLDTLLALHVAEEAAHYPTANGVILVGTLSPQAVKRWIAVLVQAGLVEQKNDLLALTATGHDLISDILGTVYDAQRALD